MSARKCCYVVLLPLSGWGYIRVRDSEHLARLAKHVLPCSILCEGRKNCQGV